MGWYDNLKSRLRPAKPPRINGAAVNSRLDWTPNTPAVGVSARKTQTPSSFPKFHFTAGDHVDSRQADQFLNIRVKLRQAFTPSQPITDRRMFAGRTQTLAHLIRAIEDQRVHTVIYGERGIGKTSMLHVLAEAAREARYLVIYVSCGAASSFDEMIRAVLIEVPLLFHSNFGPTSAEAESGKTVADTIPPGPISVRIAADTLTRVVGTRVLVILDEFDRVESLDFRHAVAELMKTLSDRGARVQMVIAGVAANLTELIENVPSIQRNIYAMQVPKMTPAEIQHMVNNGEQASGLSFEGSAINAIASRAIGFPYLASLLAHRAGLMAIEHGRTNITADDVGQATADAVVELEGRISRRSQLQIQDCVESGLLHILGPMAGAALFSSGNFSPNDIDAIQPGAEAQAKAKAAINQLADHGSLISATEDEFGRTYRFLEDAVAPYLWLRSAQSRFAPSQANVAQPAGMQVKAV